MNTRHEELSRITIDLPKTTHRKLKASAAILGKSMKEIVIEALESMDECLLSKHYPNKTTMQAIADANKRKGLIKGKKAEAIAKKLGL